MNRNENLDGKAMISEKKDIIDVFLDDHELIKNHVKQILTSLIDKKNLLMELKWILKRHIYLEEKGMFLVIELKDITLPVMIMDFFKEHESLVDLLNKFIDNSDSLEHARRFVSFIQDHVDFEINSIYPFINRNLGIKEKEKIYRRISDDISKGFFPINKLRRYYSEKLKISLPDVNF